MQHAFSFSGMPKLIVGPGAVARLGAIAQPFGRKALLVTGAESLERSGYLNRIIESLKTAGMRVHHYRIANEPAPTMVDKAAADFRSESIDVVLAVGGGSVLDGGKAIAAMLKEKGSVGDYLEGVGKRTPSGRSVAVVAVPTTSGTGSEATKNAVISRVGIDGFKKSLRHDNYIPRLAVLDASLCVSAPPAVTAACGMDALTQLIEAHVSTQASALSDALATDGMRYLIPALPNACGKGASDIGVRTAVAYGAFLSGVTLANAGLGVVHGVAGPMGAMIAIPHGVACANLLPFAVQATVDNLAALDSDQGRMVLAKFARIGKLFGSLYTDHLDGCRYLVDCLYRWLDQLEIPRLATFGLTVAHVEALVKAASKKNNPLPLSSGQMERMIQARL